MTDHTTARRHRRVLILGANGRFGLAAAQAFDAAGWDVLAQVRRAPAAGMPARAQIVALPTTDTAGIVARAAGADVVVHALNPSDYTRWAAELLPMARQGMDIAERLGARFALPGNVYNYGAAMPAVLDAGTPQWPSTNKGRLRVQFEDELRRRAPRLRSVILRAGDFFGGGTGVWLDQLIAKDAARGRLAYPARATWRTPGPTCPTWRARWWAWPNWTTCPTTSTSRSRATRSPATSCWTRWKTPSARKAGAARAPCAAAARPGRCSR